MVEFLDVDTTFVAEVDKVKTPETWLFFCFEFSNHIILIHSDEKSHFAHQIFAIVPKTVQKSGNRLQY